MVDLVSPPSMRPWRRLFASAIVFGVVSTHEGRARAETPGIGTETDRAPRPEPAAGTAPKPIVIDPNAQVPHRIVATSPLNVKRQLQEFGAQVSRIASRSVSHRDLSARGVDIAVSLGLAPRLPVLRVAGYRAMIFRAFDDATFSFSPYFQGLEGGAHLGFVEVGARFGASVVSVDVAHGDWSLGFLQPRVTMFAGLKIQELRLRAVAFSELYWRWFGQDSRLVQGLGLQLVVGAPNTSF